jgi:hypothetical protein
MPLSFHGCSLSQDRNRLLERIRHEEHGFQLCVPAAEKRVPRGDRELPLMLAGCRHRDVGSFFIGGFMSCFHYAHVLGINRYRKIIKVKIQGSQSTSPSKPAKQTVNG